MEFIANAVTLTGQSVGEWMKTVRTSGWGKRAEILEGLKKKHGLGHMHAQFLAGMYLNHGKPVYVDGAALLDALLAKCPAMEPLVRAITKAVLGRYPEGRLVPKKTYLSFTDVREFVAVNVRPREMRIGLDLGREPFSDRLRKAVLTGPMPRFTHMLVLESEQAIDELFHSCVTKSHARSHNK